MISKHWVFISLLGISSVGFSATDGNELLRYCNAAVKQDEGEKINDEEMFGVVFCASYLSGFTDSHAVEQLSNPQRTLYCLPPQGLQGSQLARVVSKYLKEHPDKLHESARMSVLIALSEAFPCSK